MEGGRRSVVKLSESTAEQLCSWQVLPDLRTAIKELVDNSIDASCKSLIIEFNNFGLYGFEVADDGTGIDPEDFSKIAKRGTTSKITGFDDIYKAQTLGFRGEALAALRALGNLTIASRRAIDKIGTEVQYDHNGDVTSRTERNLNVGSVVRVTELFREVPVRYNEFRSNYKTQYKGAMELIQAYALAYHELQFKVINQHPSKGRQTVFCKGSSLSLDQNVELLLGKNVLAPLSFDITPRTVTIKGYVKDSLTSGSIKAKARGLLQMFINKRPVYMPKAFSSAITEVYRKYNKHANPEAILFFNIENGGPKVDVNISPNKMDVIIEGEKELVRQVKDQLDQFLSKVVPIRMEEIYKGLPSQEAQRLPEDKEKSAVSSELRPKGRSEALKNVEIPKSLGMPRARPETHAKTYKRFSALDLFTDKAEEEEKKGVEDEVRYRTFEFKPNSTPVRVTEFKIKESSAAKVGSNEEEKKQVMVSNDDVYMPRIIPINVAKEGDFKPGSTIFKPDPNNPSTDECADNISVQGTVLKAQLNKIDFKRLRVVGQFNMGFILCASATALYIVDQHAADEKYNYERLASTTVLQSQPLLRPLEVKLTTSELMVAQEHSEVFEKNGFTVEIQEQTFSGQLQGVAVVRAMPHSENVSFTLADFYELLGLMAAHEGALEDHSRDADKPKLLRAGTARPSKVKSMLASRACRRSVMVGTPLSHRDMVNIVSRLGELDCPWTCPHGRPTIRLLMKLN